MTDYFSICRRTDTLARILRYLTPEESMACSLTCKEAHRTKLTYICKELLLCLSPEARDKAEVPELVLALNSALQALKQRAKQNNATVSCLKSVLRLRGQRVIVLFVPNIGYQTVTLPKAQGIEIAKKLHYILDLPFIEDALFVLTGNRAHSDYQVLLPEPSMNSSDPKVYTWLQDKGSIRLSLGWMQKDTQGTQEKPLVQGFKALVYSSEGALLRDELALMLWVLYIREYTGNMGNNGCFHLEECEYITSAMRV